MAGLGRSARIAGWLAVALALGFLGTQLWHSEPSRLAGAHATELTLVIAAGTLVYALASFLLAEAWRLLLGFGPAELDPRRHRVLYGGTQIAKYLPGNCFHFVGRQILGLRLGRPHGALDGTPAVRRSRPRCTNWDPAPASHARHAPGTRAVRRSSRS